MSCHHQHHTVLSLCWWAPPRWGHSWTCDTDMQRLLLSGHQQQQFPPDQLSKSNKSRGFHLICKISFSHPRRESLRNQGSCQSSTTFMSTFLGTRVVFTLNH